MDKQYWDALASDYKQQVLSVYDNDKHDILASLLDQYIKGDSDVADFGCGIGGGIPLLASRARTVYALDLSDDLLKRAQTRNKAFNNVQYQQCDLVNEYPDIPAVQCIVNVNVLISPDRHIREQLLDAIWHSLRAKGFLILVVPSLETHLWIYHNAFEKQLAKTGHKSNVRRSIKATINREVISMAEGILKMPDTETKCYQGHELDYFLTTNGFNVVSRSELPYPWKEELLRIVNPNIAKPWHWLVVAQKTKK